MKRKSDDKQRTISSFFASAPTSKPKRKPLAQQQQHGTSAVQAAAAGPPHGKRHKPSNDVEVIDISDVDDKAPKTATALAAAAPQTAAGTSGTEAPYRADVHAPPPPAILGVRNRVRHSKAQAKLVGAPGAASLAEPGAPAAAAAVGSEVPAGAGGSSRRQQQQQPKYTPLEQQVVALKAAHPGVSVRIRAGNLLCYVMARVGMWPNQQSVCSCSSEFSHACASA
jgi:hypothetical protein